MPSFDVRQFRNSYKLRAWLAAGKVLELRQGDKLIARIVPVTQHEAIAELPDFAARRKQIFGDRVLLGSDLLIKER